MNQAQKVGNSHLIPVTEIVAGLGARIEALAHDLFPMGRREGQEWRVGSLRGDGRQIPGHPPQRQQGRGVVRFRQRRGGGDALDLVAHALCRGDKGGGGAQGQKGAGWASMAPTHGGAVARPASGATGGADGEENSGKGRAARWRSAAS